MTKSTRQKKKGEWSNTIGYEMGTSLAKVYTTAKISLVENFQA
jgi:hypothetical protein